MKITLDLSNIDKMSCCLDSKHCQLRRHDLKVRKTKDVSSDMSKWKPKQQNDIAARKPQYMIMAMKQNSQNKKKKTQKCHQSACESITEKTTFCF